MPFTVTQLPDEPVVIVTLDLPLDEQLDALPPLFDQIDRIATELDAPLAAIWDMRGLEPDFSDILLLIDESQRHPAGSIIDSRIETLFVGTHPMLDVAANRIRQAAEIVVRVFLTLPNALTFASRPRPDDP